MKTDFTIYLIVIFVSFSIGAWSFKRLSPAFKSLCIFMGITFLSEVSSRILISFLKNSMPIYHVYSLIQYICFAFTFYYIFTSKKHKKIILRSILPVLILGVLNTIFIQSLMRFPTNFLIFMLVVFIICALLSIKQLFEDEDIPTANRKSVLYFTFALLIYSVLVLINFGLINYLINHKIDVWIAQRTNYYATLLFYSIIGITFILDQKKRATLSPR